MRSVDVVIKSGLAVAEDKLRTWLYLSTDPSSPEYCLVRVVVFGLGASVVLVLSFIETSALGLLGAFFLWAVALWARRWRRAIRLERQSEG